MDNLRFGLFCALGVVCFFLWQAWQQDYADTATPAQTSAPAGQPVDDDDLPSFDAAPRQQADDATSQAAAGPVEAPASDAPSRNGQVITVVTDRFRMRINTLGGVIEQAELIGVPAHADSGADDKSPNLRLLNNQLPNFFVVQNGLVGQGETPDHNSTYQADRTQYRLAEGEDKLVVPLTWTGADGRQVTKRYTFYPDSYRIGLSHDIRNGSGEPWEVSQYLRFWRTPYSPGGSVPFVQQFMGVAWYDQKEEGSADYKFEKLDIDDLTEAPLQAQQSGGWLSLMQHYFLGAVIPPADETVSYFAKPKSVRGSAEAGFSGGYVSARRSVAPGATETITADLFVGPKVQDQLADTAPGLDLTIDYGMLTVVSAPLFWVLEKLHGLVGNWGVAIILLTVLIKILFYKLSETQYRAMARMRKFGPRIKQLKEQYGDDREKLQSKMMDLYKKEGFNPLGGCWPMLVQMPVFIALYWVLQESVELRHAPFALWINDLSAPDPLYILPVLFGVTMWFQQKLSSSSMAMDPMQQRMMQIMPVAMAVFFAFFPAGLVLYWLTNSLLSIAQQWYIYRKLDNEALAQGAAAR
jgi:YidC/Oxa1 family membrane protein insertase